jgi:hypothetical protein
LKRNPQLAHQQDVEWRFEFDGDLGRHWYSAARETENKGLSITEVSQPCGQQLPGLAPIPESVVSPKVDIDCLHPVVELREKPFVSTGCV